MNAADIARGLRRGRKSGKGYVACCPVAEHEDDNPSLSIADGDNGMPIVNCFGPCSPEAVIAALRGLGLWPDSTAQPRARGGDQLGPIVAEYFYTDATGAPVCRVTRHVPKDFRPWIPDGRGSWKLGLGKVTPPLYRLPEVLEAPILFIVEGERDVETLREYGFVATTTLGGAKRRWRPEYTAALTGRECILVPDNDKPGRDHMSEIARALLGHAAKVTVLTLDDGSKDITEWFGRGHSECELIAQLEGCNAV